MTSAACLITTRLSRMSGVGFLLGFTCRGHTHVQLDHGTGTHLQPARAHLRRPEGHLARRRSVCRASSPVATSPTV
eukprot:7100010-Prymnesium_polylepis.1